jgi:putative endonuclease
MIDKKAEGKHGEDIAVDHLLSQGVEVLTRNFRNGRFGEVDIIGKEQGLLLFIEVKSFTRPGLTRPAEAVTPEKQHKIKDTANRYLFKNNLRAVPCRFDVVEVISERGKLKEINWLKDAFR